MTIDDINEWLNKDNYSVLDNELVVKITPVSPISLCKNKGNCYSFNKTPSKQVLCGLFQNFMNIVNYNDILPKTFKKCQNYQNNNDLAFFPIINNHFEIDGILYPTFSDVFINYELTLNVNEKTKSYQTAPTRREYAVTEGSYYIKLKCSKMFFERMNCHENVYTNLYIGNKKSICELEIVENDLNFSNYNYNLCFKTFQDCIDNFEMMDNWSKYGFTWLLNKLFPTYLQDKKIIENIKIFDKFDEIKRLILEEINYTSFEVSSINEIEKKKYFSFKVLDSDSSILNHVPLRYKSAQGNPATNFKTAIIDASLNGDFSEFEKEKIQMKMYMNPYYLSTDRIANNKAGVKVPREIALFSTLTMLTMDKFYLYEDKTAYMFLPTLDFVNLFKFHKYVTSRIKFNSSKFLYCDSTTKSETPILFFKNVDDFISVNSKKSSEIVNNTVKLINLNFYISKIIDESEYSFDNDFINSISAAKWMVISPQIKSRIQLNKTIQTFILKNYSNGYKCFKDFNVNYYSSDGVIYSFTNMINNPNIDNLYLFYKNYNRTNDYHLTDKNSLIKTIIDMEEISEKIKTNSIELGHELNKKAFFMAKNKAQKEKKMQELYNFKDKYLKEIGHIVNNSTDFVSMIYSINRFLVRYDINQDIMSKIEDDFLTTEFTYEEFNKIKRLTYISLFTEKSSINNQLENNEEELMEESV